jgi:uncharacterized protein
MEPKPKDGSAKVKDRKFPYNKAWETKWAIEAAAIDPNTGAVMTAVCKLCQVFGREVPEDEANRKRKRTERVKYYRYPFRLDNIKRHLTDQHSQRWEEYCACASDVQRQEYMLSAKCSPHVAVASPGTHAPTTQPPFQPAFQKATPTAVGPIVSGALRAHCVRLHPGDDLVSSLQEAARQTGASACFVITCVGSLDQVTLRMASHTAMPTNNNAASAPFVMTNSTRTWNNEPFEIVSLVGTLAPHGSAKHLHMSIANANGTAFGGHLVSGRVYTTVELVLGSAEGVNFSRVLDPTTGFQELVIE